VNSSRTHQESVTVWRLDDASGGRAINRLALLDRLELLDLSRLHRVGDEPIA
jgi:hypothetical protein